MGISKQRSVAVIGASSDRAKYGNKAVRAYLLRGFRVYPVNPKEKTIEGLKAYKSILDIQEEIDRATLYIPPEVGLKIIEEIARKGVKELYVNPGAESNELVDKARKLGLNPILACSIMAVGLDPEIDIPLTQALGKLERNDLNLALRSAEYGNSDSSEETTPLSKPRGSKGRPSPRVKSRKPDTKDSERS